MSLNQEQVNLLLTPLAPGRVRSLSGNSHLEAWDVRRWLLRIFGWGGWDFTVISAEVVSERSVWDENNPLKGRHTVVYRVLGRLTIKDPEGNVVAVFEDGAVGDGINQPSLNDAHDFALKTALSQALKRCAVNLGDQFGLSLYSKGSTTAVVGRSIAHSIVSVHETNEQVESGELDPETPAADPTPAAVEVAPPPPAEGQVGSPSHPDADGTAGPHPTEEEVAAAKEEAVRALRVRILDALQERNRSHALQHLTRIGLEAGQQGLMQQPTSSPAGVPMSVSVLLDEAIKIVTRKGA
jgi:hypothetical protein